MPPSNLPPHDFLDSIIAINIILFIISVIVEKITQLIRKYAPFIKPYGSGRRLKIWQNIGKKQTGRAKELDKLIEREVNSLSFIIGLVIAAAFRIDLFKMISSSDPQAVLMWKDIPYSLLDKILFFLSLPLTAFFLTFGSKFFHDLLDTLFQVKNLKRKLVDPNTFEADNIEEFDDFLKQNYHDIIEAAISQNSNLFNVPGLLYAPLQGKMIKNGNLIDCIEVHLSTAGPGSIPSNVKARLDTGRTVSVPVNVLTGISAPTAHGGQGGGSGCRSNSRLYRITLLQAESQR
ncbi:hypothetical protein J3L18_05800 [Mucilaginibacter gossypii]|uniref:hypothetical protein n=1 Tax=Mucilaginibacter gossypii TaxID=551996 RepID=UPI000DCEA8BD|nr:MULTISPECIES: hypothetical protein [Mucilaginibacter]QTE38587.1 hypothetical protein J3L18_05800 [Mucilaginibacter gossypii]RAV55338.1 hypothetical protein DIU36_19310 [Mucilaginibacter rubeus]